MSLQIFVPLTAFLFISVVYLCCFSFHFGLYVSKWLHTHQVIFRLFHYTSRKKDYTELKVSEQIMEI